MDTHPDIEFDQDGRDFILRATQTIPRPLDEVFPFFADAHNLQRITPPKLRFRIITPAPIRMHQGALIDYRISLRGFPMRWRTKITRWDPPHEFEDSQIAGPYAVWVHTHTFDAHGDSTRMADTVRYRPPMGPIGRLANRLMIRRDLQSIFTYRARTVREMLAPPATPQSTE